MKAPAMGPFSFSKTSISCFLKNSLGGLSGGTKTYEQAVEMKSRWEAEVANDPFAPGDLKAIIVEAQHVGAFSIVAAIPAPRVV